MVSHPSLLVLLLDLMEQMPLPPCPPSGRGRPTAYSERLFLKALVIRIVKRLHNIHELLGTLAQPTREMEKLREHLRENGRYPSRRTFERRLARLPETLPAQIGYLGRFLVGLLCPFKESGRASSMDSMVLRAKEG